MKCRYKYCKHGGEVEKAEAVKDDKFYYHKECYEKNKFKKELKETLKARQMAEKHINIVLKRAIDDEEYNLNYIDFVYNKHLQDIKNPYNLLYFLKFDVDVAEWKSQCLQKEKVKLNQEIKLQEFKVDEVNFTYKPREVKRYKIY